MTTRNSGYIKALLFLSFSFLFSIPVLAAEPQVTLNFFHSNSCPHCREEKLFLSKVSSEYPGIAINSYEVTSSVENLKLFQKTGDALGADIGGVPFLVVGSEYIVGYDNEQSTGNSIKALIDKSIKTRTEDAVARVLRDNPDIKPEIVAISRKPVEQQKSESQTRNGLLGLDLNLETLPLPLLTVVIALLDGFNPCAMWVLLFLITLLLGMEDRKKIWLLGGAFLITSGAMYFLFLSAWLNFFLIVGYAIAIRYGIGALALLLAVLYIRGFIKNKTGCPTSESTKRKNVFDKIKKIIENKQIFLSLVGIVTLAIAVNVVELLCSAGLPAVYTKILSMNTLAKWQYYLYLALYILIFMADDLVVFIGAMITFQAIGLKSKYSRYTKLVGGIIIGIIGVLLILKPELLSFK